MTEPDPQAEHEELERLFDRTAAEASGPTLTKLGARAGDVPRLAARRFLGLPRWAWGPASIALLAAFAGVFVLRGALERPVSSPAAAASVAMTAVPSGSVAVAVASEREVTGSAPNARRGEELGDNLDPLSDADEGARFDVSGPQSDRDLDAWLAATKDLSGGT